MARHLPYMDMLQGQRMSGMPLKRLVIGVILPLCSVRAYPYVDEWAESGAPSTRAVLPDAVDALVPALRDRGPRAPSASSSGEDD